MTEENEIEFRCPKCGKVNPADTNRCIYCSTTIRRWPNARAVIYQDKQDGQPDTG